MLESQTPKKDIPKPKGKEIPERGQHQKTREKDKSVLYCL